MKTCLRRDGRCALPALGFFVPLGHVESREEQIHMAKNSTYCIKIINYLRREWYSPIAIVRANFLFSDSAVLFTFLKAHIWSISPEHVKLISSSFVPPLEENAVVWYSLLPGPGYELFSINPYTGLITTTSYLDREQQQQFTLRGKT